MNVSLTSTLEDLVQKKVASGLYNSASEVVREALRLLELRDREREVRLGALRDDIAVGLGQLDRGDVAEFDDESLGTLSGNIKSDGRKRLAAKRDRKA